MYVCMYSKETYVLHVCIHVYMYIVHVPTYIVHVPTYMYIHVYTLIYMCVHVYSIYMYICRLL